MRILAIDPGPIESAYVVIDADDCRPIDFGKIENPRMLATIQARAIDWDIEHSAIEMVASYGMAVGAEVFDTCVWIGRFSAYVAGWTLTTPGLVKRLPVKLHHCHDSKAKDSNITQALVDRFAHGQPNHGKGAKTAPGWFYGFHKDIWQAYALAVYVADTRAEP